jgi:hypothetical protein
VCSSDLFKDVEPHIKLFAGTAKLKCETLRTYPELFEIWPAFVVAGEHLCQCGPRLGNSPSRNELYEAAEGEQLLEDGKALLTHIARARVPMPSSANSFIQECARYLHNRLKRKTDPSRRPGGPRRIGRLKRADDLCRQD